MKQIFITIVTFLMIMLAACATETTSNSNGGNTPTTVHGNDPHNNPTDSDDNIPEGTIFRLTLDSRSADTTGTQNIYLKYDCGYYLDESCDKKMTVKDLSIDCPTRDGYRFLGYNTDGDMYGDMVISYKGFIDCDMTFKEFRENTTLVAVWKEYNGSSVVVHDKEANKGVIFSRDGRTLLYYQRDLSNDTYEIPEGVTDIAQDAFRDCIYLKHVKFPDSLTKTDSTAFKDCTALESVDIGRGVEELGADTFEGCTALKKVNYRGTIAKWCAIKFGYYYDEANPVYHAHCLYINDELLTDLVIPDNVTEISDYAFRNCTSIESVTIGKGLTRSGYCTFMGCTGIKKVNYLGTVAQWCRIYFSPSPILYSHNFYVNDELVTDLVIPDGVTSISEFTGCKHITSVSIPDSVTWIDSNAFAGCTGLTGELRLPSKMDYIGSSAFAGCSGLTKIVIPDLYFSISQGLLAGCTSLEYLSIPYIGGDIYYEFSDEWDTRFGGDDTPECERWHNTGSESRSLSYIFDDGRFEDNLNLGGEWDWSNELYYATDERVPASLKTVVVRGGKIADFAFEGCSSIEHIELPDGITRIGEDAFRGCASLKSITIPDTVTEIGVRAFQSCVGMEGTITIPSGVKSIRYETFKWCGAKRIDLLGVTGIAGDSFMYCPNLTTVNLPNTLTYIGNKAFAKTKSLESLVIPDSVTDFGQWSYMDMTFYESGIRSITLGSGVREIGRQAFYNCDRLESIDIPDNVTKIGDLAFNDCDALLSVRIGNGVIEIGDIEDRGSIPGGWEYGVFGGCDNLRHLTIGNSVKIIHDAAFAYCYNLTGCLVIPDSVEQICASAFGGCDGITCIDIGANVKEMSGSMYNVALDTIICRAVTPPNIGKYMWSDFHYGNVKTIYVPADSISLYQTEWGGSIEYKSLDELP
ncbi:MAG: leucine-rich repeat domain-containing protein [Spirochaetales bacterium]|nr:leucine-rich repeat domain-containing protein [Spirochaetales bacterium]